MGANAESNLDWGKTSLIGPRNQTQVLSRCRHQTSLQPFDEMPCSTASQGESDARPIITLSKMNLDTDESTAVRRETSQVIRGK